MQQEPLPNEFNGPRLVRAEELAASDRLSHICFGGIDLGAIDEASPPAYHPPRRGGLYVITHRGIPVSQIYTFHFKIRLYDGYLRIGSIGGVCTHPDYREQRLAGRLLEHCTNRLAQEGARLMLISGGRGLYTRAGCVPCGIYDGFKIEPHQLSPTPPDLALRQATSAEAAHCSRLYHTEPVHFERKPAKYVDRLGDNGGYVASEAWIIERSGKPVAYLLLGIPWEYLGQPGAGIRHVREYAGSRTALVGALGQIMNQSKLKEIHFPVALQDADLLHLLQGLRLQGTPEPLEGHTMRLINFPGLMADLRPYLQARLGRSLLRGLRFEQSGPLLGDTHEDRFSIARGSERLDLDGAAMTYLVMGNPEDPTNQKIQAPAHLQEVISALFPLPSFYPGLNYQ
jgi:GNAT superfamily N-acetyltransferase